MMKRPAKHTISAIVSSFIVWMAGCVDIHTPGARDAALRQSSRNNMKQIVFALLEHYEEKEQWPDGLDELLPLLENNQAVFHNPLTDDKPGYEYVKPSGPLLGSDAAGPRTAVLYTILAGAKRHRIEPWAYVRDLLLRLHAEDACLEEMLPDRWAAAHPDAILTHRLEES